MEFITCIATRVLHFDCLRCVFLLIHVALGAGACLLAGAGVPMDEVEALAHFARAAELSYAPAQYQIGMRTNPYPRVSVRVRVTV